MGCAPSCRPTGSRAARATGRCTTSTSPRRERSGPPVRRDIPRQGGGGEASRGGGAFAVLSVRSHHGRPTPSSAVAKRDGHDEDEEGEEAENASTEASASGTAAPGAAAPSRTPPQSPPSAGKSAPSPRRRDPSGRLRMSSDPSGRLRMSSHPPPPPSRAVEAGGAGAPPPRRLRAGARSRRRCSSSWRISPSPASFHRRRRGRVLEGFGRLGRFGLEDA